MFIYYFTNFINMNNSKEKMLKKGEAGANIQLTGHKCYRCRHEWLPHHKNILPKVCPKCKTPYWDKPKIRFNKKDGKTG